MTGTSRTVSATAAFVLGLYLPFTSTAPNPARHCADAMRSWAILFLATRARRLVAASKNPAAAGMPLTADGQPIVAATASAAGLGRRRRAIHRPSAQLPASAANRIA